MVKGCGISVVANDIRSIQGRAVVASESNTQAEKQHTTEAVNTVPLFKVRLRTRANFSRMSGKCFCCSYFVNYDE